MSARTHFLKKLQAQQLSAGGATSRSQADIAAFRQSMEQLQATMAEWLAETGIQPESTMVSLTDLLVEGGAFDIPGITLRYGKRSINYVPLFLYGHGVTGCVEVSLHADGKTTLLCRLFMRAGQNTPWTCTRPGSFSLPGIRFDEDAFFGILEGILL
ncbi:Uncharacterised protein [Cedecea lapagei]|uniref:Uncharacterized protein n=1 Tax=Cedecea lapagei TaxID=158823 RepID=A0A447V392_9ENTR|nr:hypothetical protein [Cedecea lapagei]VEB98072.1 Uncharacterised protein [Cedecea lapagei]